MNSPLATVTTVQSSSPTGLKKTTRYRSFPPPQERRESWMGSPPPPSRPADGSWSDDELCVLREKRFALFGFQGGLDHLHHLLVLQMTGMENNFLPDTPDNFQHLSRLMGIVVGKSGDCNGWKQRKQDHECDNFFIFLSPIPFLFIIGQHRIMGQELLARDFAPAESLKRAEILCVFPTFQTAQMGQKIRRKPKLPLCGVAIAFHTAKCKGFVPLRLRRVHKLFTEIPILGLAFWKPVRYYMLALRKLEC